MDASQVSPELCCPLWRTLREYNGNQLQFLWILAADAERRTSAAGKSWVRLRVGVGKGKAVQWVRIVVLGGAVEAAAMLKRGTEVHVEGRLSLDKWRDKDGAERYSLSVVASKITTPRRSPADACALNEL